MNKTNRYEFLLVLRATNADETKTETDRLTADFHAESAAVEQVQNMDRRHFAHVAGDLTSGTYVNFIIECDPGTVDRLRARFKLDPAVYRQHCQKLAPKKVASSQVA